MMSQDDLGDDGKVPRTEAGHGTAQHNTAFQMSGRGSSKWGKMQDELWLVGHYLT